MFGPNFQVEEGTPRIVSCVLLQLCRVRLNLGRVYVWVGLLRTLISQSTNRAVAHEGSV
jgi:hypothetical protein